MTNAHSALNALDLATISKSPRRRNRADRIAEAQVYALLAIADAIRGDVAAHVEPTTEEAGA